MSLTAEPSRRRRSREGGRRRDGEGQRGIAQLPWKQPRRLFPPMRLVSDDELEAMHLASLQVLEEIGMEIVLPEAREILQKAGRPRRGRAGAHRARHHRGGDRPGAGGIHLPCPQPGTFHPHRRRLDRLFARRRPAQLLRCRARAAARHLCRQPEFHPPVAVLQLHPRLGRRLDRCPRHPCLECAICISGGQRSACPTRCCLPHRPGASGCSTASRWRASPAASARSR